jgi:hypothetical protein
MSKHAELPLALLAALALSACAVDDFGEAVTDSWDELRDVDRRMPEEEFPEVRTKCGLPGAALARYDTGWRLSLPSQIYAARASRSVAGRIACVEDWARGRGLTFAIAEAP